jgi:hypothetical protein
MVTTSVSLDIVVASSALSDLTEDVVKAAIASTTIITNGEIYDYSRSFFQKLQKPLAPLT